MPKKLLSIQEVTNITKLSQTTIWRLRKNNKFPQPFTVGERKNYWRELDIEDWFKQLRRKK